MNRIKKITTIFIIVLSAALSFAVPASAAAKIAAPAKVTASVKSETSVSVSWSTVKSAAKYIVYYSTDSHNYTTFGKTTKTSATVKKLRTGTKYYFAVRAVDKDGNKSAYSKSATATPKAKTEGKLKITRGAGTVNNNAVATIKAIGKPNTAYTLKVYYSSKVSEAEGTGTKKSDANGYITWSWKVGAKTKAGTHKIVIEGGGEKLETSFETVK